MFRALWLADMRSMIVGSERHVESRHLHHGILASDIDSQIPGPK